LVYPNFTNALSLAHRIGVEPTIETVKRLETGGRAREEQKLLSQRRPNKRPRVKHDDEVSLGWSSDDDVDVRADLKGHSDENSRRAGLG